MAALGGYAATSAGAGVRSVRVGSAPRLPRGARLTGSLAQATRLQLAVALEPQDPTAMQSLATAVSTPGSPYFRQYLSVSQFAQRFGATSDQITAVTAWLRSTGLTVGAPPANHLTLPVSGTAAQVQQAFGTSLAQVKLPNGRVAYANTVAPTVAPQIAGVVQGVVGLDNLAVQQPQGLSTSARFRAQAGSRANGDSARLRPQASSRANVVTGGPQPCPPATTKAGSMGGYTADTIASAYGFSSLYQGGDLGAGQTIAVYELQPYNPADIAAYQACYATSTTITNVSVDNAVTSSGGDDTEAALDIEQVIGLAPKANILVYVAPNSGAGPLDAFAAMVSQDQAKVLSSSWGTCEANALSGGTGLLEAENSLFQEAALQGQSVYVASGDAGSAACSQSVSTNTVLSVGDPGSQPFVTGVGGTTLYTTGASGASGLWAPGAPLEQGVWNDGVDGTGANASTGGVSSYWGMPAYQSGAAGSVGVINAQSSGSPCGHGPYCREVPDVSADASPVTGYVIRANGGWTVVGGTSAATPLWAAFTGLVNASPTCGGRSVGFVNPGLYQIAGYGYAANLSDVTLPSPVTGQPSNDAFGVNGGLFPVGPGYDMATGLGTPVAPTLATSLCQVFAVSVSRPAAQSTTVGTKVSLQENATDSGGAPVTFAAAGLPPGLSISASTGLISGAPTTAGTSSVTVSATDQFHNSGSAQFSWTVTGSPKLSRARFSGLASGRPKLTFTAAAGGNAPALGSVSVVMPGGVGFARKSKSLSKGISVRSGAKKVKFTARVRHGVLTISFRRSETTVSVTVANPSISVSGSLRSKVRHRRVRNVSVGLRTTDTSNRTTRIVVKLKV